VALAVIGVVVVLGSMWLRDRNQAVPEGWRAPQDALTDRPIVPQLGLLPVANVPDALEYAVANAEWVTAYAILISDHHLDDAKRLGWVVLLGQRLRIADELDLAVLCYQQAMDLAILSPTLSQTRRADALLAAGKGWATLGQVDKAVESYDQVLTIAVAGSQVQPAHRLQWLESLEQAFDALGETERAASSRQQIEALRQQPAGPPVPVPPAPIDLGLAALAPTDEALLALTEARRQAAQALIDWFASQESPGASDGDAPPDLVARLGQALQAEDQARMDFYQAQLEQTVAPKERVALHRAIVDWLGLKAQVAMRFTGLSVVPEWEVDAAAILSAISMAYDDLYLEFEDMAVALPDVSLISQGQLEVVRWALLMGRLGLYPNYPETQRVVQLDQISQDLIAAGQREVLYVTAIEEDASPQFRLVTAEGYPSPAESP
jgi:tetratricopeptide (TPR) repeat protein